MSKKDQERIEKLEKDVIYLKGMIEKLVKMNGSFLRMIELRDERHRIDNGLSEIERIKRETSLLKYK